MNVVDNRKTEKQAQDIVFGECFEYDDTFYIRVNATAFEKETLGSDNVFVLNIHNGFLNTIDGDTIVSKVEAKVIAENLR